MSQGHFKISIKTVPLKGLFLVDLPSQIDQEDVLQMSDQYISLQVEV